MVNTIQSLTWCEYEMATRSQRTCNGVVISIKNELLYGVQLSYMLYQTD